MKKVFLFALVISCFIFKGKGQGTAGKDFWVGFMAHSWDCYTSNTFWNNDTPMVFLSSQVAATVKITAPGQNYSTTVTLVPNVTFSLILPRTTVCRYSDTVTTNGVHISSDQIINVYAVNRFWYSKGATVVIPTESIVSSPEYVVTTDEDTYNWGWSCNGKNFRSAEFVIVGVADSSVIEIVPTGASTRNSSANIPFQITLKKGETFQYLSTDKDLTGSIIRSKYPLSKYSVFAGNRLTIKYLKDKNGNACYSSWDHTYEQMMPTVTWGNKYTALPFKNNLGGYYLKVVAAENNTKVYINNTYYTTLKQAGFFEYMLYSDTVTTVTSTNRISVAQFTKGYGCANNPNNIYNGDPAQMQLFPDAQFGNNATVNTVSSQNWSWWSWWNWWKPENYINIMVNNGDTSAFTLNYSKIPNSLWKTFGSPPKQYAQVKIDSGSHYMQSNKGFLAYVYGYSYVEGYAYAAAAKFKPIQNNFIIVNAQCKKDTVQFLAIQNDSFSNFTWKFGDGSTASGTTVKHKYADTGWYSVKMYCRHIITNAIDSVSKDLYVADTKIKSLFNKDTAICGPVNMVVISKGFNMDNTYKWNDGHPVYYRAVKNPGILWLEVVERNGCIFRDTLKVTNSGIPKANFSVSKDIFCLNRSKNIVFKNLSKSIDTITEYIWDFGEKTMKSMDSVVNYQFKQANTYAVILRATTKYGCFHDTFQIVDVLPSPSANFSFTKKDTCFNSNGILLKNNTILNITEHKRYKWYFSEGYVVSNNNPVSLRTYAAPGNYQVMLIYENNNKCIDTMIKSLTIYPHPTTSLNILSTSLCTLDSIQFKNTTTSAFKPLNYFWNWGDSTSSITNDTIPKHSYLKYGSYTISLVSASPQGCTDTFKKIFLLDETPLVNFTINKDTQCLNNQSFNFTNLSSLKTGTLKYQWLLGNGSKSTDSNILNFKYVRDSVYFVKLIATSSVGCNAEQIKKTTVGGYPKAGFSVNNSKQCFRNNSFSFSNSSSINQGTIASYKWNYGNTVTTTLKNISSYNYVTEDTFVVQLIANSNFGCSDTVKKTVITFAQPKAAFTINIATQCFNGHLFKATNSSSIKYGKVNFNWNFGDNTTSIDTNVFKTYAIDNSYQLSLIVTSDNGCKDTFIKAIQLNASPKAKFSINNSKQCFRNNNFTFSNNTTIRTGSIAVNNWNMGNGVTSTNTSIANFKYITEDTFIAELIAVSNAGCSDTTKSAIVTFAQPKAQFIINNSVQCFNQQRFIFTNKSTLKYGLLNYKWSLGDGSTSTDTNINKTYLKDSIFNLLLIASSDNNCRDTFYKSVTLFNSPVSNFIIPLDKQCFRGNSFNFNNKSTILKGSITEYKWDLDDGFISSNSSVLNYKYLTEDTFNVKLISKSNNNCYDTLTKMAITFAQPIAKFLIPKDTQCWQKNYFDFNNQTYLKYGKSNSLWKFGDNTSSTDFNPLTKKYANISASYNIKYNVVSDHGCKDSFTRKIVLLERPISDFSVNDSIQCFKGHLFSFVNKSVFSVPSTLSYWWTYGNGDTNVGILPKTAVYNNPGLYNVKLVSNSSITNCYDTLIKIVIPAPHANVNFSINKDTQCLRFNDFRFNSLSTLQFGDMTYKWNFKDNTSDTAKNPTKHYTVEGIYKVKLVVATNYDCWDSIEKPIQFYVTPIAKYKVNDAIQCLNKQSFDFLNLSNISKGTFKQNWSFDDNTSDLNYDVINKTFTKTEDIYFYLSVRSENGCTDTSNGSIYIEKGNNSLIGLNENDSQCLAGNTFNFKALNINSRVVITNYYWKYGDGQTAVSAIPASQSFNKDGNYLVRLNTVSVNGCMDTVYRPIVIHPQPITDFSADPVCFPEPVNFINSSIINTGTIDIVKWYFGDASIAYQTINPVKYYKAANKYNISLVNISNYGCQDSVYVPNGAQVDEKPKADFDFNRLPTIIQDEIRLQFINRSSNDANKFLWDFGNITNSVAENPVGIYQDTGRYSVTQIVFNKMECSDTITKSTGLLLPDFFYYLPNTFTPNSNGLNEVFKGIGSQYVKEFTMEIFNRWGELIFKTNDIQKGWDGNYQSEPCMEGTYMCRVYIIPLNGSKRAIEQTITLLR